MRLPGRKLYLAGGFVFLSVLFLYLRLKNIGHLLMWDEAWNILSLRAFLLNAAGDPFYWFYRFHPPLYMTFAGLLFPFRDGFAIRLELLSLFFAYGTFLAMYLLSARIGGWRYAWFSGLFLSVMPGAIGFDTWIKRDSLASFLGYLALLVLVRKRFFWCGVLLGLSMLSKESGIFFLLSALFLILVFREKKSFLRIAVLCLTVFVVSSWWYIFYSEMTTHGPAFFFSKGEYSMLWAHSSMYYLKKLLPDMGIGILFFLIIGAFYLLYLVFRERAIEWSVPVIVVLCVYLPVSFLFTLKAPWLSYPAFPALAMAAGGGALYVFKRSVKSKLLLPVLFLALFLAVFTGLAFSYQKYFMKTYPNGWPGAYSSRELAQYLNGRMKDKDRLMITRFTYWEMPTCPVFLYYWKPHEILILPTGDRLSAEALAKAGRPTTDEIMENIRKHKISWFVVVGSPDPKKDPVKLVGELKETPLKDPEIVGWSYVWNTEKLWQDR
ncbi:MAG: hypothetical protein WBD24_02580 [Candidatus Omnitrophota bacterium]